MQEGLTPKKINYSWIEIVPVLVVLVLVVVALAVIPNCLDRESCVQYSVSQKIDIDKITEELSKSANLFNNTNVEKP